MIRALGLGPAFHVVFRETIEPSANRVLDYELRPGARDGASRISSAGLRDAETPRAKPPGVFRIAAIGDSVTYASGGPRELGWVDVLETLLGALAEPGAPRFEVLNLGVPGYNAAQVVERLRSAGLGFAPDAIVYGYVLNDPQAFSLEGAALREMRAETERGEATNALTRALAHSRLYLWARATLAARARRPAHMPADPAYAGGDRARYFRALHRDEETARRFIAALDELAAIARAERIPALVAIFPLFPDGAGEDPLADVHEQVSIAARADGLAVLDLLPIYSAARSHFRRDLRIDFLHPDALGNRVAAWAVLAGLCRERMLPPGALDCARAGEAPGADGAIARVVASALAAQASR